MCIDTTLFCTPITRGRDGVWVPDLGVRGRAVRGKYRSERIQELLELGEEFLTASYASGLKTYEGHQEQHVVWLRMPKATRDAAMPK